MPNGELIFKKFLKSILRARGLEIRRLPYLVSTPMDEIERGLCIVDGYTMLPYDRLASLYDQVAYCERNGVEGALVECGVWKGGSVALMAAASLRYAKQPRHIHLFDSFEEICEPNADIDGDKALREVSAFTDSASGRLAPLRGFYDSIGGPGTLEENQKLLEEIIGYPAELLHYHKGWFQDTVPGATGQIGPIAILRLDGDWYESTKVCLDHLYDAVISGGMVIIDDYGTYEGCQKAVDEFLASRQIRAYLTPVDAACRYFIKV